MNLTGKNILVTGGAGFIGSHLVDKLIQEGCFVRVIDNLANGKLDNLNQHKTNRRFRFILGSILNNVLTVEALKDIDIVFHLACLGVRHSIKDPFENHRVNAEGALRVLELSKKAGVKKLIFCSSSEVYGSAKYVPMDECHPTLPRTVYGASKLAGEAYARAFHDTYGLKTVIIRPFNAFGPRSHHEGDAGEMIPKSIVRALNGKPVFIFGDGSQTRDFTYVQDIASGLYRAATHDNLIGSTFNIGSGFEISIKKVAQIILKAIANFSLKVTYLKSRPGDVSRLYADANLFARKTGWEPTVSFREGILKTISWFKSKERGLADLFKQEAGVNWE